METVYSTKQVRKDNKKLVLMFKYILAVSMLCVFINPGLSTVLGPLMAVIFSYLFFEDSFEFVTAVIITANDALGTVVLSRLSFQYLLLALLVIKALAMHKYSVRRLAFLLISLAFLIQLFVVEFINAKTLVICVIYAFALASIDFEGNPKAVENFFKGIAFAVVLISIHAVLTGGVEYYELDVASKKSGELVRKGILGVGIGNANYSAILLNMGLVSLWHFTKLKTVPKVLLSLPILYSLVMASSVSGIMYLAVILLMGILLIKGKSRTIIVLVIIFAVLLASYNIYINLPSSIRFEQLDYLIERVVEKYNAYISGDFSQATTGRSNLISIYLDYIFNKQDAFGVMFGGNPLIIKAVSNRSTHNTFINILLQFGVIGTVAFCALVIWRFVVCFKKEENPYRNVFLIFKVFFAVVGFGAGLYANNLWMFWMLALVLL